jgi:hypothetical protein
MTETDIRMIQKNDAYQFLKKLEKHLNATLPPPQQMRQEVRDRVMAARRDNNKEDQHLKDPESVFTNHFLIPRIFGVVSECVGNSNAQQCMLGEYLAMRTHYTANTSPQRQALLSCTRFRRHRVRCFMEQEVRHGEKAVYTGVQA